MDVKRITDAAAWDGFLASQPESQFLQSWQWGEFQKAVGYDVFRFGVEESGQMIGVAQALLRRHGFGICSLTVYRGPVIDMHLSLQQYKECFDALLQQLKSTAREHRCAHIHMEPAITANAPMSRLYSDAAGWKHARSDQPEATWLLDLHHTDEELLAAMHEKTRYNIRLAERKGVTIHTVTNGAANQFLALQHQTAQRKGIHPHPDSYFRAMLLSLTPSGFATVSAASLANTILAVNIVFHFGDTTTYAHGASSDEGRNTMAPHLLQWHQICEAKKAGARWYDFGGVAPAGAGESHPWVGISRFKKGFGGEVRTWLPGRELSLRPFHYRLVQLRRKLRG